MYNAEYVDLLKINDVSNINIVIEFLGTDDMVTLGNDDILDDGFSITRRICDGDELLLGSVISSELKFMVEYSDRKYVGQAIYVWMYLNNDASKSIPIGYFYIDSDVPDGTRETVEITAHDILYGMQNMNVKEWYDNLIYPLTMREFRNGLFEYIGLPQNSVTLVNDNMLIEKTIDADFIAPTEIMKAICEANGTFGRIDRQGNFDYVILSADNPVDIDANIYYDMTYENYTMDLISGVVIRQEEGDIGGRCGSNDNAYVIENNFLFYGKTSIEMSEAAQNIFDIIKNVTMVPFNIDMWSITVDPGDCLRILTPFDEEIVTYAMSVTTNGIIDMEDEITNSIRKEQQANASGIMYDIKQLKGKSNVLVRDVEQTRQQIADVEQGLRNEITATAGEFDVKISDIQRELDGEIQQFNVTEEPTLYNYPAYNFTNNIKVGKTFVLNPGLRFEYTEETYKKYARSMAYDATTGTIYRFQKEGNEWLWKPVPNTEYSLLKKDISDLNIKTNEISASVTSVEYKIENNYFTKEETNAKLDIQSKKIELKVSKGDVSSALSVESGKIAITSNRFSLDSTNCKITEDGSIVAKNLDMRGGKINISSSTQEDDLIMLSHLSRFSAISPSGINIVNGANIKTNIQPDNIAMMSSLGDSMGLSSSGLYIQNGSKKLNVDNSTIKISNLSNSTEITPSKVKTNTVECTTLSLGSLEVGNILIAKMTTSLASEIKIGNVFSKIGFFDGSPVEKQKVSKLSTTATLSQAVTKINDLLTALNKYNLIGL